MAIKKKVNWCYMRGSRTTPFLRKMLETVELKEDDAYLTFNYKKQDYTIVIPQLLQALVYAQDDIEKLHKQVHDLEERTRYLENPSANPIRE